MKILIVDDNPALTNALARVLRQRMGYEVEESHDSLEAADHIARNGFDLAIIDWRLPGKFNGIQLGKAVRRQGLGTFLMSGFSLQEIRENWEDPLAGFVQFFAKPIDTDLLIDRIERVRRSREGTRP